MKTIAKMMNTDIIQQSVALGEKLGHVFVATADAGGLPHLAAAGLMRYISGKHVEIAAWFCPGTLANLQHNRKISLTVWDAREDLGYQLLGKVEEIEEGAVMNGYTPKVEGESSMPQFERKLQVHVDKVIAFSHAPHSDVEK
jgi:hypothetical protein